MGTRGGVYRGRGRSVNGRDSKNIWPLEPYFFWRDGGGGGGKPPPVLPRAPFDPPLLMTLE